MEKTNPTDLKDACRRIMLQHEAYTVAAELLARLEAEESPKPYITITNEGSLRLASKKRKRR